MLNKKGKLSKWKIFLIIFLAVIVLIILLIFMLVPSISLKGNKRISVKFGEKYIEPGFSANLTCFDVSGRVKVDGVVNEKKIGEYKLKYTIYNFLGTSKKTLIRNIKIYDDQNPVIELQGNNVLIKLGDDYKEPGYKAIDNYDGDITNKVVIENKVNTNSVGEYEIIYKAIDSSSNETTVKRKVIVYDYNVSSVPILTYHNFMTSDEKRVYAISDKYTISTDVFEQQLKYLKDNGYNSISLDDLYLWYVGQIRLTDKDFVITIDDGNISAYRYAIPILEKYGFKSTIFVITGRITSNEQIWDPSTLKFFNNEIINDIIKNHKSVTLASHTHYLHSTVNGSCAVASKNEEEVYIDVKNSKDVINSQYLAYPFGCATNDSKNALIKAGYKMAFLFGNNLRASKQQNIYELTRLNVNSETTMQEFISWLEV